jgi:hypothetical protein
VELDGLLLGDIFEEVSSWLPTGGAGKSMLVIEQQFVVLVANARKEIVDMEGRIGLVSPW